MEVSDLVDLVCEGCSQIALTELLVIQIECDLDVRAVDLVNDGKCFITTN